MLNKQFTTKNQKFKRYSVKENTELKMFQNKIYNDRIAIGK